MGLWLTQKGDNATAKGCKVQILQIPSGRFVKVLLGLGHFELTPHRKKLSVLFYCNLVSAVDSTCKTWNLKIIVEQSDLNENASALCVKRQDLPLVTFLIASSRILQKRKI